MYSQKVKVGSDRKADVKSVEVYNKEGRKMYTIKGHLRIT